MQPTKANAWRRIQLTALIVLAAVGSGQMLSRQANGSNQDVQQLQSVLRSSQMDAPQADKIKVQNPVTKQSGEAREASIAADHALSVAEKLKQNPFPYRDQVEVVATGYFAGRESTGKNPGHPEYGITFSGVKVRKDTFSTIAADPKIFPIGTVMYIPGYGYGVVADTGSAIKGNKIDLYFETKDAIYSEWGKRTVKVNVLMRGEGRVTEAMLDRLNAIKPVTVPAQP